MFLNIDEEGRNLEVEAIIVVEEILEGDAQTNLISSPKSVKNWDTRLMNSKRTCIP